MTGTTSETHELVPRGPFSLQAAAGFSFGPTEGRANPAHPPGTMRLTFPIDGGTGHAGMILRQPEPDGPVTVQLELTGDPAPDAAPDAALARAALAQAARILSLDHDGNAFTAIGDRDPILKALQDAHPGQRPVLFPSPYEAAAWSILSARRPAAQGAKVRSRLGARLGATFNLDGFEEHAFPQPERLLEIDDGFPGLNADKVERLHGVARAALAGDLDVARLHELGPQRAYEEVQKIKGIGPFYATLVVVRGSGFADALVAVPEPKLLAHAAHFYQPDGPPTLEWLTELAEQWRPFRTWATVLIRLAGSRGTNR
jgi:DNA-3-methyladenine glycosylase II